MEKPTKPKQKVINAPLAIPNLDVALEIEPHSIQKTVLDLGMNKKYNDINTLIQNTSDLNTLKKLILLQLNLALFILNRIQFDPFPADSNAFQYPEQQTLTTGKYNRWQAQWWHLFFESKQKLAETNSFILLEQALILIHEFLEDIGYVTHDYPIDPMNFIESNRLDWIQNFKEKIAKNFKFLFEHLFVVLPVKPISHLPAIGNLLNAINDNDLAKVERLISFGIPVENPKDTVNYQPLSLALTKGNEKIIDLLIRAGASITEKFITQFQ